MVCFHCCDGLRLLNYSRLNQYRSLEIEDNREKVNSFSSSHGNMGNTLNKIQILVIAFTLYPHVCGCHHSAISIRNFLDIGMAVTSKTSEYYQWKKILLNVVFSVYPLNMPWPWTVHSVFSILHFHFWLIASSTKFISTNCYDEFNSHVIVITLTSVPWATLIGDGSFIAQIHWQSHTYPLPQCSLNTSTQVSTVLRVNKWNPVWYLGRQTLLHPVDGSRLLCAITSLIKKHTRKIIYDWHVNWIFSPFFLAYDAM